MASDRSHDSKQTGATHARRAVHNPSFSPTPDTHPLLQLHRLVGNQRVARMVSEQRTPLVQRDLSDDLIKSGNQLMATGGALMGANPQAAGVKALEAGNALILAGINVKTPGQGGAGSPAQRRVDGEKET